MCLAIPGQIKNIYEKDGVKTGLVSFGGKAKEICLEYLPETKKGDFVITHEDLAIKKLDQKEAEEMLYVCSHLKTAFTDR